MSAAAARATSSRAGCSGTRAGARGLAPPLLTPPPAEHGSPMDHDSSTPGVAPESSTAMDCVSLNSGQLRGTPTVPATTPPPKRAMQRPSVPASDLTSQDCSAKRQCPTLPSTGLLTSTSAGSYKVVVKPRCAYDMSKLPNQVMQRTLDGCLGTTGFSGYTYHRPTNTISVWVPTLEATAKLQTLQSIPVTETFTLPVQAYLTSGTDLKRYVVSGVDVGQDQATLSADLTCPTHKVVSARYLGRSRTCLVTLSGPSEPPSCLYYFGCILRVRPYRPSAIFCYQCLRPGHMKASCPTPPKDADMEAPTTPEYRCSLCRSNDHDITSAKCPTKCRATEKLRENRRQTRQNKAAADTGNMLALSNRYEVLAEEQECDESTEPNGSQPLGDHTYATAVKRRRQPPGNTRKEPLPSTTDCADSVAALDHRLAELEAEMKRIRQRRATLAQRAKHQETPVSTTATSVQRRATFAQRGQHHDAPAPPPATSAPLRELHPDSSNLTATELLTFVAEQLQHLATVLVAHLRP
ncbi:hypothetical protein HPB48_010390 [Haemaphysalis longicornis]|uniref:CCHC-type domain-containing protein n=1 Tax=Haemaphysalis longicornis TaxID=44386 RepID=A0A9J6FWH6_HAELO|nr:hypothetical protein HPB48_010390 [Haemaphysalis longicornis]